MGGISDKIDRMMDPMPIRYRALRVFCCTALCTSAVCNFSPSLGFADESLRRTPIVRAIERVEPAVVNIQGNKVIASSSADGSGKQTVNGMGSGVIISENGLIVTNLHVVQDVNRIEITLADGSTTTARLINFDPKTDLALIKIEPRRKLPVIKFGTSCDLLRGETVIAIGNPFGYQHTVTTGIISALHRNVPVNGAQEYEDLIQTNADINPGNSGGPLLNIEGDVIGINVAVRVGAQGIGFAIPIDKAMDVIADLVSTSRPDQGQLGIALKDKRTSNNHFVQVYQASSEARQLDIQSGDRILNVEDHQVGCRLDFELAMLRFQPGDEINLFVERDGQTLPRKLRIPSPLNTVQSGKGRNELVNDVWSVLGIRVVELGNSPFTTMEDSYKGGFRITDIRPGSPAAQQRIQTGDVLVGVQGYKTPSFDDLSWVWTNTNISSQNQVELTVTRGTKSYKRVVQTGRVLR